MFSTSLIVVALAGVATAATPSGFVPAATKDLFVSFGETPALNGAELPKDSVQTAPTIGTAEPLVGTYTIMMVDPDVPGATEGAPTTELLHWMQSDLVSANTSTTIGGMKVYELINPTNTKALASYAGPAPPNKSPQTHRYTQILLQSSPTGSNTTSTNSTGATKLVQFAMSRANFSAQNVIASAGLVVIAGNSFDVTATDSTTGIGNGNSTIPGASPAGEGTSGTGTQAGTTTTSPVPANGGIKIEGTALIALLGAMGAVFCML